MSDLSSQSDVTDSFIPWGSGDQDGDNPVEMISNSWERRVIIKKKTVIKTELREHEFLRLPHGKLVPPYWSKERLRNEAATVHFVASRTTIPVPKCRVLSVDGLVRLEATRIFNGVPLADIHETCRPAAIEAVEQQMTISILPQLRSIRRSYIGSVDDSLPVVPPQRVYDRDRRSWPRISSALDDFVLCHNDLGPQNIFVDPHTFQIVAIIDWEFAGFYPSSIELPLWRERDWEHGKRMVDDARSRELQFFKLKEEDLIDCTLTSP